MTVAGRNPMTTAIPRAQRVLIIPYALMVAAWMFDFRGESERQGLAIQIIFLCCYVGFFAVFLWMNRARRVRIVGFLPLTLCTLVYLAVSVTSGLLRGQDFYPVSRHVLTILVYLTATYATARMVVISSVASLRRILALLCLGFAVSTFFIVLFFQGGVDVSTIRYQIQGASSIAALGLLVLVLIFSLSRVEIVAALSAAVIIFLTITRTFLVVIAAQGVVLLPAFRRFMRPRLAIVLATGVLIAALLLVYGGESADRWVQRLYVREKFGGIDPTLLTRYVEWEYMFGEFVSSVDKFLFGSGLAAETAYWLPRSLGGTGGISSSMGFGHSQHLSLLFTAGAIGGAPLLYVQFLQGWQGFRFLSRATRYSQANLDLVFLGAWGATIIIGTLASNFLGSSFGSRGFSLWYGIGTGLLLGARTWLMRVGTRTARKAWRHDSAAGHKLERTT